MTRKEQIFNAATKSYGLDVRPVNNCTKAFSEGAKWADSNPNWHKFPEEKPTKYDDYIVHTEYSDCDMIEICKYDPRVNEFGYVIAENWLGLGLGIVKAWMEKPVTPKFD